MKRRAIQLLIVLFWLAMAGWLFRYEAFPGWFTRALPGYRAILPGMPVVLDSWMKISFKGKPIGYSQTQIGTDEKDPSEQYKISSKTILNLNIMGEPQNITIAADASLNALYDLQKFYFMMAAERYTIKVGGRRKDRETFYARIASPAGMQHLTVKIPDDAILYSPMLELSLSRLKPGQEWRVKTLDPTTLSTADVLVRALGRETLTLNGKEHPSTVLEMDIHGMKVRAWMDADGRMLKQDTPFGWTMEACTAQEAMGLTFNMADVGDDMLKAMAVPVKGEIDDPRQCRLLTLRLTGGAISTVAWNTGRQRVDSSDESEVVLTVLSETIPLSSGAIRDEGRLYLGSTAFVQSDHPDIIKKARAIVGDETDPIKRVRSIYEWVYRKVKKEPTVSLPSALDVLQNMEGDCNEHTYLFVALARAVGIPAKIKVGLLYTNGTFYYHAWPAVFVGRWWELDPTIGQEAVDATHVAILEGETADQLKLLGMIGRLNAEVVRQEYP
jgi:hypothetical protein